MISIMDDDDAARPAADEVASLCWSAAEWGGCRSFEWHLFIKQSALCEPESVTDQPYRPTGGSPRIAGRISGRQLECHDCLSEAWRRGMSVPPPPEAGEVAS
jgi:hypothetical protein